MRAVAIGGGHGSAMTLQALRGIATEVQAIVSVADNGGSSGILRELLKAPAIGDARRCLGALAAEGNDLGRLFEYRFEPSGHPLGNLVLAAAWSESPSLTEALQRVARMLECTGSVLPATEDLVDLVAETPSGAVVGQTDIHQLLAIEGIRLEPPDAAACPEALEAIRTADLVVLGPGSLYTSVLAAMAARGLSSALSSCGARRVWVANISTEYPETAFMSIEAQYQALSDHGIVVDTVIVDEALDVAVELDAEIVRCNIRSDRGLIHDPVKMARAFAEVMTR